MPLLFRDVLEAHSKIENVLAVKNTVVNGFNRDWAHNFNDLALRFTKAYIVQLINLLAPFFVILFNRLLKQSALPKYTVLAITLSVIGASLMIFGGLQNQSFQNIFTPEDGLGIFLAFLGTIGIAAYMMIVKRGEQIGLPFEVVYISQVGSMMIFMSLMSISFGENWSAFRFMDWRGVAALLFNAIGVEIGCKLGNITVLRKLGAPLVSSMLAVRLVAALFLGGLSWEQLSSFIQWGGVLLVVVTITGYLTSLSQTELKSLCPTSRRVTVEEKSRFNFKMKVFD